MKRTNPFTMKDRSGWSQFAIASKMAIVDDETNEQVGVFMKRRVAMILRANVTLTSLNLSTIKKPQKTIFCCIFVTYCSETCALQKTLLVVVCV